MEKVDKASVWSVPVVVADLPDEGKRFDLSADAAAREAVARLANLREVSALDATFDVSRRGAGVQVSGEVRARVGQTCVVSLEPMENAVSETVDLLYLPSDAATEEPRRRKKDEDPPEPLVNGVIDLGAVATEFLILGLDPYPRKAGAAFATAAVEEPATARENPFKVLEALKKPPESKLK